jgi:DNA mismatch endonuclease (patch repair protein)
LAKSSAVTSALTPKVVLLEFSRVSAKLCAIENVAMCGNTQMDKLTSEQRSWNMSRIKGSDTGPERRVRSVLHQLGFRFSLRRRDLPGRPDIVLVRHGAAVFVHGCFWHRHNKCGNSVLPKTRQQFWLAKLNGNVERDKRNLIALKRLGWQVITVWECEVEDELKLSRKLLAKLRKPQHG